VVSESDIFKGRPDKNPEQQAVGSLDAAHEGLKSLAQFVTP
jgi:hypothetical protein